MVVAPTPRTFKPYLFEQGFQAGGATPSTESVFSAADVARERAAALAEGRAAGFAEASRSCEARVAAALEVLVEVTERALDELDRVRAASIAEATAVAAAIAAKLLPDLYRREAASEIETVVAAVLPKLFDEPHVEVRVSPVDLAMLTARLTQVAEAAGYGQRLTVAPDSQVAAGDCRITWASGGAERNGEALWGEIEAILADTAPLLGRLAPTERMRLAAGTTDIASAPGGGAPQLIDSKGGGDGNG